MVIALTPVTLTLVAFIGTVLAISSLYVVSIGLSRAPRRKRLPL